MPAEKTPQPIESRYMLLEEIAAELRLTNNHLRRIFKDMNLPYIKPYKQKLVLRTDFENYLTTLKKH